MTDFEYVRAQTVSEVVKLLNEPGIVSRVLAGGTDLVLQLRRGAVAFDRLIDVTWIPALRAIAVSDSAITIGAAVTCAEMLAHAALMDAIPILGEACRCIGGVQVRNMATIGGNVANAAPCADLAAVLICLDASALVVAPTGEHRIPVAEWLAERGDHPGVLVRAFVFAPPSKMTRAVYLRVERRQAMAIARAALAVCGAPDDAGRIASVRLVPGAVFDYPRRMSEVEAALVGQVPAEDLFVAAGAQVQAVYEAASGERWSVPYSGPVLAALTERALRHIFA